MSTVHHWYDDWFTVYSKCLSLHLHCVEKGVKAGYIKGTTLTICMVGLYLTAIRHFGVLFSFGKNRSGGFLPGM